MARRVELVADWRLLDSKFEGYKLASGDIDAVRIALEKKPLLVRPPSHFGRSSLLHARLHGLHNALFRDPFGEKCYYVDEGGGVRRVADSLASPVWSFDAPPDFGEHHPTLAFPDPNRVVLSTGDGALHVFTTGDRSREESWRLSATVRPLDVDFSVLDAKFTDADELHCVLYHVRQEGNFCVGILDWVVLTEANDTYKSSRYRSLKCPGAVHYASLEINCDALYVAADRNVDFVQSDYSKLSEKTDKPQEKRYSWIQTNDDITLTLRLSPGASSFAPSVDFLNGRFALACGGVELLEGELLHEIDHDLTTWKIDNVGKLSVVLTKKDVGRIWKSFMKDGDADAGEQIMDPSFVAEVHERLAHLCSETEATTAEDAPLFNSQQLEDCDFSTEEESCLLRLDPLTFKTSHKAFLSSHQIILSIQTSPTECPCLGLRYDADTCIWQPYKVIDGNWSIKHEGTLKAFGYVQSSKQQKKYTCCSPNLEYCVVCEPTRHAFIYRQNRQNCHLRQRNVSGDTKKVNIGKQQLISFDRDDEILGICATDENLYFLTGDSLIVVNMLE